MYRATCVALAFILSTALFAADNPRIGTWKQNLEKSTYSPGPKPKMPSTLRIEEAGNGEKMTVNGFDTEGKPITWGVTSTSDGKPFSIAGSPYGDTGSVKMIDTRTSELTYTTNGKVTRTTKRTVAADGKTMTIEATGVNSKGERYKSTVLYEKQ